MAFATLRREKEEVTSDLLRAHKRLEELEAQIADRDRDILSAKTDCKRKCHTNYWDKIK